MDSNSFFGFRRLSDGNVLLLGPDGSAICVDDSGRIRIGSNGQPMTINQVKAKKAKSYSQEEVKVPLGEYHDRLEELFHPRMNLRTMELEFNGVPTSEEEFESLNVTLVREHGLKFQKADMQSVLRSLGQKSAYDPIHTYLDGLGVEGAPILSDDEWDQIAVLALGLGDSWSRKVVQKQLLSAAARVFDPGCKVDYCLILHGAQGLGKSSYFRALAGDHFTDSMGGLDNIKDDLMVMHGSWFAEWSEADQVFVGANKAERIKRFVSTQEDRFRVPYGRSTHAFKRRGILCGTTNRDDWANDPSGNRRFPVLSPPAIDIDWINENRDRIWSRVVVEFRKGSRWWFSKEEEETISQKAAEFCPVNDECENAFEYLKSHSGEWVSTKDLMILALGRDPEQIKQKEVSAFARQMSGLQRRGALRENRNYWPRKALSGTRIRTTCWSCMSV